MAIVASRLPEILVLGINRTQCVTVDKVTFELLGFVGWHAYDAWPPVSLLSRSSAALNTCFLALRSDSLGMKRSCSHHP